MGGVMEWRPHLKIKTKRSAELPIRARLHGARNPRPSRNGPRVLATELDGAGADDLRAFGLGPARRTIQGGFLRESFAEAGGPGMGEVTGAACPAVERDRDGSGGGQRSGGGDCRKRRKGSPGGGGAGGGEGSDPAVERVRASLPSAGLQATVWSASAVFSGGQGRASFGMFAVCCLGVGAAGAGRLDRMDGTRPSAKIELGGGEYKIFDFSVGAGAESGEQGVVAGSAADR